MIVFDKRSRSTGSNRYFKAEIALHRMEAGQEMPSRRGAHKPCRVNPNTVNIFCCDWVMGLILAEIMS